MRARRIAPLLLASAWLALGCASDDEESPAPVAASGGGAGTGGSSGMGGAAGAAGGSNFPDPPDLSPMGGDRPVSPIVPSSYDASTPTPLLILLHGYSASGPVQSAYLGVGFEAERRGFLLLYPDGTRDSRGNLFWNATDACCDRDLTGVDDVAYVVGLVEGARQRFNVDPKRVYLMGHSNGGFMSHRLACDRPDVFAAIASLAGAVWSDASNCTPSEPVSVLQMHGTDDDTIFYQGGDNIGRSYPSAEQTRDTWAQLLGCSGQVETEPMQRDYLFDASNTPDTTVSYWSGCPAGAHSELWALQDGAHLPGISTSFTPGVFDFFLAHPKP